MSERPGACHLGAQHSVSITTRVTSGRSDSYASAPSVCAQLPWARMAQHKSADPSCVLSPLSLEACLAQGVQNHTPEVIVIDEIGRPAEVEAARTCKTRGVRMIASDHGDLRNLLKNKQLRGLVGGVEAVTLGDAARHPARSTRSGRSTPARRPIFDVIIVLRRDKPHEWHIVMNSAKAVDDILLASHYLSQRRTRDRSRRVFH